MKYHKTNIPQPDKSKKNNSVNNNLKPFKTWIKWLILSGIIAAIIFVYSPISRNGFLNWDDDGYVYENRDIQGFDKENIKEIFTKNYVNTYLPLTMLSYAIDYQIGKLNPATYTYTNLLFHIGNSLLVFWFILLLAKQFEKSDTDKVRKEPFILASITSVLFAVHPFNVESVAWIAERKNLLFSFFFLLSLVGYIKYIKNNKPLFYLASIFLFLCSLLSKGTAVSLTLCVVALDYFFQRKLFSAKVIFEKIPFFILSLIFGLIAFKVQGKENLVLNHPYIEQIAFASYGFIEYLYKLIIPINLLAFYSYPEEATFIHWINFIIAIVLLSVLFKYRKRLSQLIIFGILFFIANIIFLIQLIPVGNTIMADRYIYLSSIGFFLILAVIVTKIASRFSMFYLLFFIILILYGFTTHERVKIWNNSLSFWDDVIKKDTKIPQAWNNRGIAKKETGDLESALSDINNAIIVRPDYEIAYYNCGDIKKEKGDFTGALEDFNKAIDIRPVYKEAYCNRGNVKKEIGDYSGSLSDFDKAISIDPRFKEAYNNRGITNFLLGKKKEALFDFSKAIEIDSSYSDAYYNRGKLLNINKEFKGSLSDLNKALLLNPNNLNIYSLRAKVKLKVKDYDGVIADCNRLLEFNNNVVNALIIKALANYQKGRYNEAIALINSTLQKNPTIGISYYLRGMSKLKLGNNASGTNDLNTAKKLGFVAADNELLAN